MDYIEVFLPVDSCWSLRSEISDAEQAGWWGASLFSVDVGSAVCQHL